ncbi:sodium-dependent serotonin transporter-like isoform X2 [Plodia interpunctella]|uniref:sodium-dependent serotonin transporter-like isoform X2 n=1 Tax=Plodia interpunctella TaxID=58824 RepID=UPI0023679563|nr:sodium-dependent serotonin transporter-like isoform X2 [Plodia interpunctella]
MPRSGHFIMDLSSSMTLVSDKAESGKDHFKWDSIKIFLYFTFSLSSCSFTFDMFSKVADNVRILDFIVVEIALGMPYMFMEFFIKQYTRKLDFHHSLNPLLKGVTYGSLLQTALHVILHACDLTDGFEYLAKILLMRPFTTACPKPPIPNFCLNRFNIGLRCEVGRKTWMSNSSVHVYYDKKAHEATASTTKVFAVAIVWICNFFFSTVSVDTLLLISKLSFLFRAISSCFLALSMSLASGQKVTRAVLSDIMSLNSKPSYDVTMDLVAYIYGIGYIGVYDFRKISPFVMVDNTVIIFAVVFTLVGFVRSFIVRVLYVLMTKCIVIDVKITYHYLIFGVLPLGADYLPAHRLYLLVIYGNIIIATLSFLSVSTLTLSRLLHREFRSLKNIYIVGILCFIGFVATLPLAIANPTSIKNELTGLKIGLCIAVLYLGGVKVALVMWIYGVNRFSTDIHYWLGFKPTKFWRFCWSVLPIVLFGLCFYRVVNLTKFKNVTITFACIWFLGSCLIVIMFQLRTIAKFMVGNITRITSQVRLLLILRNQLSPVASPAFISHGTNYFSEVLQTTCMHNFKSIGCVDRA